MRSNSAIFSVSAALLLYAMISSSLVKAAEPLSYAASYSARSSGLSATAERSLVKLSDSRFRLQNELTLKVIGATLGAVSEYSEFNWNNDQLQTIEYSYTQTGISRKSESVAFNWEDNIAISKEDDDTWELPIDNDNTDKLSYQFLLQQQLLQTDSKEFTFHIVDTDEIDTHLYRAVGTELVETELGKLNTVRVERIRAEGSRRSTTFWLAVDWGMLLVKFVQTDSSGSDTELLLQNAEIDGQPVTALP